MSLSGEVQRLSPLSVRGNLPEAIGDITADSREVGPGWGFVAIAGSASDGHDYVVQAAKAGATVIFVERAVDPPAGVAVVHLRSTRDMLPELAALAYGHPTEELAVIGITGTNGKTTTTWLLEAMGESLGKRVGIVGTISHRWPGHEESAINTTPGRIKLARMFRQMVTAGVDWVAIEVSSHGLVQGRLDGIAFDVGVWTNLSRDHLDYHGSMATYRDAKASFFSRLLPRSQDQGKRPVAVVNAEDHLVRAVFTPGLTELWDNRTTYIGLDDMVPPASNHLVASAVQGEMGWYGSLVTTSQTVPFTFPLVGRFNLLNALGAAAAVQALGFTLQQVGAALGSVRQVPGRMEMLGGHGTPRVFVDYAHTPDALARAIDTVRQTCAGDLYVVFGCGGDRDATKRPEMGRVAADRADHIVITNDNPRTESPQSIADAVLAGIPGGEQRTRVELDRAAAVTWAVHRALPRDVVLVAGKGHETYQIIGTERQHMDDRLLVSEALESRGETGVADV